MFDPMRGPAAKAMGTAGEVRIGGLRVGRLIRWRLVVSPKSTPEQLQYVLFGEGPIGRFYGGAIGAEATARVEPAPQPARIGRKKPPTPRPFTLRGTVAEISPRRIVIAEGVIG
jgi:hypothetical protein